MATLGKDIDKKETESYMTSPRRRSVVIDDERCVEIPIQMNPQLDVSKLRSVAGRPPTPIPSDEEDDEDDDQQQQQQNASQSKDASTFNCSTSSQCSETDQEGTMGSGERLPMPTSKKSVKSHKHEGVEAGRAATPPPPPPQEASPPLAEGSRV